MAFPSLCDRVFLPECWKYQVLNFLKPLEIAILNIPSQRLCILMYPAVLSSQVYSIILVRNLQLFALECILNGLSRLRIVISGVSVNLPRGL
jgi:hypothetical protein